MCGIAGSVNWANEAELLRMTQIQAHRGPDDQGVFWSVTPDGTRVGLGSRRLAILDLSAAGRMPMSSEDGLVTIVYNGEVYNYPDLRHELEERGRRFRSGSDVEAILYLYEEMGAACLSRLNGMFAMAIWDGRRNELFLARDHFGIKPLYYCDLPGRLAFASEVKALLTLPECPRALDINALSQFLTMLWVPDPATAFQGIHKLPAGHYATYRAGRLDVRQYWDLSFPPAEGPYVTDGPRLAAEFRERFDLAVRGQMLSDVPIGAFLSAGLDSSSIVSAMAKATSAPVRTYTIAFPDTARRGETLDDTDVAARTAARFGCLHEQIVVEPEVVDLLPKLIYHMDEPIADPAILTAYLVCREAKKSSTVLLSGVGGDELLAGYRKHVAHGIAAAYRHLPAALRQRAIEPAVAALPALRGTPFKGAVRLLKKFVRSASLPPEDRFLMDSVYCTEALKRDLLVPQLADAVLQRDPFERHRGYFAKVRHADFLNQMLYLDTKVFMVSLNLCYNDKMSMASSVEVRVPFLDVPLTEWVARKVPPSAKLAGRTTKALLRRAMTCVLPDEVLRQPKAGFGAPIDRWLSRDLRPMMDDLLSENAIRRRGVFQPAAVRCLIDEHMSGRADHAFQIWQLLTLELWHQTFIDTIPS